MTTGDAPRSAAHAAPLLRSPLRRKNLAARVLVPVVAAGLVLTFARPSPASLALGALLVAAGEALRLWAAGHLVKTQRLTLSGPYRYLRHPLYAGTLLIGAGFLVAAGPAVAALALPIGLAFFFGYYLPYKERRESARLARHHGDAFRAWRAAVPALLPRLRSWRGAGAAAAGRRWQFARVVANDEIGTALLVTGLLAALLLRA
jgi:protein-S-isoprenylcysteine O-methyltransferase Ste14